MFYTRDAQVLPCNSPPTLLAGKSWRGVLSSPVLNTAFQWTNMFVTLFEDTRACRLFTNDLDAVLLR